MNVLHWIGKMTFVLFGLVALLLIVYFIGPREKTDLAIRFDPATIGNDPDSYLAKQEAEWPDIVAGSEKRIIWADPAKAKTPLSVIYIHGFSADAAEVRPLPDRVAKELGANLYFTRLRGHGRKDPDAMGEASLNAWLNDYAEALAIGRKIGDRVIVIATSTGASITTWALAQPELRKDVAAAIFISPNYGIQSRGAFLLTGPWAKRLAYALLGPRRGFEPSNEGHATHWTHDYPTKAILPMAQSVQLARETRVEDIETPALFMISSKDDVVRPDRTREIAERWAGPHMLFDIGDPGGLSTHVLAGDILNPATTEPLTRRITDWLRREVSTR